MYVMTVVNNDGQTLNLTVVIVEKNSQLVKGTNTIEQVIKEKPNILI